jgi:SAM-dependent methyltransferase
VNREILKSRYPWVVGVLRPAWHLVSRMTSRKMLPKRAKRAAFRRSFTNFAQAARQANDSRFDLIPRDMMPIFGEDTGVSIFDAHYVFHTSWAARLLQKNKPAAHHDFASDIRFATIASAFVSFFFYDYRPLFVDLEGLTSLKADLTDIALPSDSISSLSCMHVIEHIGLGRYGDPIDPQGDLKAIRELQRILAPGGDLYFVVPVGSPRLRFNAHRIYSFRMIRNYFETLLLEDFSLVTDDGRFTRQATEEDANRQKYGCGCFWFHKAWSKG